MAAFEAASRILLQRRTLIRGALATGLSAGSGFAFGQRALADQGAKPSDISIQVSAGRVEHFENRPSRFIDPRHVSVWLPPSYDGKVPHSVLYMHDGQNIFEPGRAFGGNEWGIDETLSRLIAQNKARPTIVVGVWNTPLRLREFMPTKVHAALPAAARQQHLDDFKGPPLSDGYLAFLVHELKPFIDARYATLTNAANTFLMGSSMGGLISLYGLCEHPRVFGGAACLSIHWPSRTSGYDKGYGPEGLDQQTFVNAYKAYLERALPDPRQHRLYIDIGDQELDSFYPSYKQALDPVFAARGWTDPDHFRSELYKGTNHSEAAWRDRVSVPLHFLLRTRTGR